MHVLVVAIRAGNAKLLTHVPGSVDVVENRNALLGGVRLWTRDARCVSN
jgi:hypothetical protein